LSGDGPWRHVHDHAVLLSADGPWRHVHDHAVLLSGDGPGGRVSGCRLVLEALIGNTSRTTQHIN
jgi:hypothetical protein